MAACSQERQSENGSDDAEKPFDVLGPAQRRAARAEALAFRIAPGPARGEISDIRQLVDESGLQMEICHPH